MRILSKLEKVKEFWFLLITLFAFYLLRLPSLFEPYWYGDEGIYQAIGVVLREGGALYLNIWDNKPPLLYLIYAAFNASQFWIRTLSLVFGLGSVLAIFFLSKKLFEENLKAVFVAVSFFALFFGIPLLEGNIANSENFMILPILLSGLLVFSKKNSLSLFTAGLLVSLAFLIKIVGIFDFLAFAFFLFTINFKNDPLLREIRGFLPFILGFLIPIFLTSSYFLLRGTFYFYIDAILLQMFGYVGQGNEFIIPQGLLILKSLLLVSLLAFLFFRRDKLSKTTIFILSWVFLSLFNAFFSQRPYTHYLLTLLPSFSLLLGLIFYNRRERLLNSFILVCVLILVVTSFNFGEKTLTYYGNFISFISGNKTLNEYRNYFDRRTPTDYLLAQFSKTHTSENENIFIWGNNAQVYALARKTPPTRFSVAYHITSHPNGLSELERGLEEKKPKYIFIMPYQNDIPFDLMGYSQKYIINDVVIYERLL